MRLNVRWLAALVIASVIDLALTILLGIAAGPDVEWNPLIRAAWEAAGWSGLIGGKVMLSVVGIGMLAWSYAPRWLLGSLTGVTLGVVALNAYSVVLIATA